MDPRIQELIQEAVAKAPPLCAGLIDQGFIGSDPVGHACTEFATTTHRSNGFRWNVCRRCASWLDDGNGRVSLPLWRAEIDSF